MKLFGISLGRFRIEVAVSEPFGSVQPGTGGVQSISGPEGEPTPAKSTSSTTGWPSTVPAAISWRTSVGVMMHGSPSTVVQRLFGSSAPRSCAL